MEEIDVLLFIDTVISEGCRQIISIETDGFKTMFLLSLNGNKRVAIDITDETITNRVAKEYCRQLGLIDLVERLFND